MTLNRCRLGKSVDVAKEGDLIRVTDVRQAVWAALEEIIEDGKTGLLYEPGCVDSLRDAISSCLNEDGLAKNLGGNAKEWVMNNRTWNSVVKNYPVAYQFAIDSMR